MLQIKSITEKEGIGSYTGEYFQFDFIAEEDSEFLLLQDIVRNYLKSHYDVNSSFGLQLNQNDEIEEILGFEYPKNKLISLVAGLEPNGDRCTFGIVEVRDR